MQRPRLAARGRSVAPAPPPRREPRGIVAWPQATEHAAVFDEALRQPRSSPDGPLLPEGWANPATPRLDRHAAAQPKAALATRQPRLPAGQAIHLRCMRESGPSPAPSRYGHLGLRCVSGRPPSPRRQGRQWHEPDPCPSRGPIVFGNQSSQEPHSCRAGLAIFAKNARAALVAVAAPSFLIGKRKAAHYRPEESTITIQQDNGDRSAAPTACRCSSSSFTTTPHEGTVLVKHAFYRPPSGPTWHDPHLSGEVRVLRRP